MIHNGRNALLAVALATLLSTPWAPAAAAPPSKSAMIVLRGPEPAVTPTPVAVATAPSPSAPLRSLDPSLAPDWPTSPRVGGYSVAASSDGGQCRLSCARDYYVCQASPQDGECGGRWSQCLTSCPSGFEDGLGSGN